MKHSSARLPPDPFQLIKNEMDLLFEDFFATPAPAGKRRPFLPSSELTESDHNYLLNVAIPATDASQIRLDLEGHNLLIQSGREGQENFHREVSLPANSRPDLMVAEFSEGVLRLAIPKETSQRQKIEIKGSKAA